MRTGDCGGGADGEVILILALSILSIGSGEACYKLFCSPSRSLLRLVLFCPQVVFRLLATSQHETRRQSLAAVTEPGTGNMEEPAANWTEAEVASIRAQLRKILGSDLFTPGQRQSRFLNYIVEKTLSRQADQLNQFAVAMEVFDRDESFNPSIDAIVRVEAGRLRSKLTEYYAGMGKNDPILIALQGRH